MRQLIWGLPASSRQIRSWRARAQAASDAELRSDALSVFVHKRTHVDGAAVFWTLPERRHSRLLRLLVAYEAAVDFLDYASERGAFVGQHNGRHLHLALADALTPGTPIASHYRYHRWARDGGYLLALVMACREHVAALPSFASVAAWIAEDARRCRPALAANHDHDPVRRDRDLKCWAKREFPHESGLAWWELSAAASGALATHALLVLAADSRTADAQVRATYAAYMPWVALSTAMFDSWADQIEDAEEGSHSYVAHYDSASTREARLQEIASETMRAVLALPDGRRHAVIVLSMIAMYLTKDAARTPELAAATRRLARAAGTLTVALVPILRAWRIVFLQRAA